MATASINKIIPLEIASAIIEKYDSTLNIVEGATQVLPVLERI